MACLSGADNLGQWHPRFSRLVCHCSCGSLDLIVTSWPRLRVGICDRLLREAACALAAQQALRSLADYAASNIHFLIFSIACGVSSNLAMFIVFRLLMGISGCPPLILGGGTIADLQPPEERGMALSVWTMGPLLVRSSVAPRPPLARRWLSLKMCNYTSE